MVFLYVTILAILMVILICLLIYSININIEIINFKFSSINNKFLEDNFKAILRIRLFGRITVFRYISTKEKRLKLKAKKILKEKNKKEKNKKLKQLKSRSEEIDKYLVKIKENIRIKSKISLYEKKKIFKYFKNSIFNSIKKLNIKIEIGTTNPLLSSSVIPILGTVLSYIYMESDVKKDSEFKITPIYYNKNLVNIELFTKFNFKISNLVKGMILIYKIIYKNRKNINKSKANNKKKISKKSNVKLYKQRKKVNTTNNINT